MKESFAKMIKEGFVVARELSEKSFHPSLIPQPLDTSPSPLSHQFVRLVRLKPT
jgi:hypothetical protein